MINNCFLLGESQAQENKLANEFTWQIQFIEKANRMKMKDPKDFRDLPI